MPARGGAHLCVSWILIALATAPARAEIPVSTPAAPAPEVAPAAPSIEDRLRRLEADNARLTREVKALREDHDSVEDRFSKLLAKLSGRITGYLDFGFFYVQGDGSGIRPDIGYQHFPEYKGVVPDSWVFMGDPLSTMINSRGDPADTDGSRAVTFDSVHNGGAPSFIVNSLTLSLFAGLGRYLTLNASFDLMPRNANVSVPLPGEAATTHNPSEISGTGAATGLGSFMDIKLAYLEYTIPTDRFDLRLSAGKFDSVLGIEYRGQESPDRITITPSLICRYTCGRPLGVKARGRFFNDWLIIALAVTNGSSFVQLFPFYEQIDTNLFKTISMRLATRIPIGAGLEIGGSGAFGAQDFQKDNSVYQWQVGADLHLDIRDFDLRAEYQSGAAEGKDTAASGGNPAVTCGDAPCLHYQGAYGQAAYRVLNWLMPYVRVDWRDAIHRAGLSFVYVSNLVRFTGGVRVELGEHVIIKAEYTYNHELGRIPQFANDVFTSSMVVKF
jgi:hypothetical protein